jgi:LCP family protein required for cell wall assembly
MANRRNDPYGQDGYYDQNGYYDDGYTDQNGYYDDGYSDQNGYYDDGYTDQGGYYDNGYYDQDGYDQGGYYDDGYYQDDYYNTPSKPSMAARASGKANPDPYRRSSQSQPRRTQPSQSQYYETSPRPRRRKKKRHPFRKLLLVLLILAAILAGLYFLLFQAPEQTNDGLHTRKDGFYNILICATDEEELRTDTIMIASLDQENGTISLTSLPRDTIVDNGQAVPKLNGVYGLAGGGEAGAEALMDQVETLLGFRPDGYAIINYQIFKDVVDAMGGVTFDVPMDMIVDNANDPDDVLEIAAGEQVLDGTMALGVCRYRYGYLMADIQRQYVQQSFLKAMVQQLMSPKKLLKLPAVYSSAMDNIETNLSGANIRYLCLQILLAGTDDIQQNTLPGEAVTYNGSSCYGLYGQSVVDLVNQVMNPYEEPITLDDVHILTVSGGTLVESTWSGTAFDASTYQYD